MLADLDGKPVTTDGKDVYTFVSSTKAIISASLKAHPIVGTCWGESIEADVAISGSKMTVTSYINEHTKVVDVFDISPLSSRLSAAHGEISLLTSFGRDDIIMQFAAVVD